MLSKAQSTMRQTYVNGGPGVLVSGLVWLLAATVTYFSGFQTGIIVFFFSGMLIHPFSVVLLKRITANPPPADKKLVQLSILTLPILFVGLYLAYIMSANNHAAFYPIMAMAIGVRYLIFQRIYGLKEFLALGLLLAVIGAATYMQPQNLLLTPCIVGAIEVLFGLGLTQKK